jgi:heme-degrading monooxygenase HmoA
MPRGKQFLITQHKSERSGEISYQLLKFENDANNIVHFSQWSSLQNARNFFESERLVEIRKQAGVKAPQFVYLDEMKTASYSEE